MATARRRLLDGLAVGQHLLEVGDARISDLGVLKKERLQPGQPLEVQQPRTRGVFLQEYACCRAGRCEIRCS